MCDFYGDVTLRAQDDSFAIIAGGDWDPYSDLYPFAAVFTEKLVKRNIIKGKSIVYLISSQYSRVETWGIEDAEELSINVKLIDNPELEQIKEYYLKHTDHLTNLKYDNIICTVINDASDTDYPIYDCYVKNTILVASKNISYIINIGYPNQQAKELDEEEIIKKLVIPKNISQ